MSKILERNMFSCVKFPELKKADLPGPLTMVEAIMTQPLKPETILMREQDWDLLVHEEEITNMRGINDLTLKVKVSDVLQRVKANREQHEKDFKEAVLAYRNKCAQLLSERLNKVQHLPNEELQTMTEQELRGLLTFNTPCPKDFLAHYDQVIGALEMATDQEIELTGRQINAWCKDRWEWQDEFFSNTRHFMSQAGK